MTHITTLHTNHIPALYQLYCATVAGLPHTFLPSETSFGTALLGYTKGSIIVAEDGIAQGLAVLTHVTDDQDTEADAIVALLATDAQIAASLISDCLGRANSACVLAYPQTHGECPIPGYNAGWDGLSEQLPATAAWLQDAGFTPYYRELLMACDLELLPAVEAQTLAGIRIEAGISSQGSLMQRAWIDEERIGLCFYETLAAYRDDTPQATQIGYVHWLWTEERYRQRGVARELMQHALAQLIELGCTTCWLGTGSENLPAQALYRSFGFGVVDTTISLHYHVQAS
jgi:ribosomal protein S18 acetylase RimI-like enzyme